MPDSEGPATAVVEAAEQPTEAVAETMDDAADLVREAAEQATEEGQDELAKRLGALEVELRGHLQHAHGSETPAVAASETVATPVAAEAVEVAVPEPVVKPRKLHLYQRARFL